MSLSYTDTLGNIWNIDNQGNLYDARKTYQSGKRLAHWDIIKKNKVIVSIKVTANEQHEIVDKIKNLLKLIEK